MIFTYLVHHVAKISTHATIWLTGLVVLFNTALLSRTMLGIVVLIAVTSPTLSLYKKKIVKGRSYRYILKTLYIKHIYDNRMVKGSLLDREDRKNSPLNWTTKKLSGILRLTKYKTITEKGGCIMWGESVLFNNQIIYSRLQCVMVDEGAALVNHDHA